MALDFDHFTGFNAISNGALFHPEGSMYVGSAGGNVILTDLIDSSKQEFLRGHSDNITCLAVSKSGALVASGQKGGESNVYVWDFETRQRLYCLEEHDHAVQAVAFSHDEKILATIGDSEDRKLYLWDMSTGNIVAFSNKLPVGTLCVQFGGFIRDLKRRDTDHYLLCTGGKEGIMLWDLDPYEGDLLPMRLGMDARASLMRTVTSLAFSVDCEYVYGATTTGDFLVASMKKNKILHSVQATKLGLTSVLARNDGGVLVGCGDHSIKIFDNNFEYEGDIKLDGIVVGLCGSADGVEALATTSSGTVHRINIATKQFITIAEAHTDVVTSSAFSVVTSDRLATASQDSTIRVWDTNEYIVLTTCHAIKEQEPGVYPTCLQYSDIVISGWSDGKVISYSDETGQSLWLIDSAHPGGVFGMTLSHNKRFILTGGPTGEVRLWELRTRDLISNLKEHVNKVTSLALSADDTFAVTCSRDRCILRWDLREEKRVHCHMQRMGGINGIALAKDERYILSVGQEKRLSYWGIDSTDTAHTQSVDPSNADTTTDEGRVVVLTSDGKYVLTGGTGGIVRLWDYASGTLLSEAAGHSGGVTSISVSPDDKQVVSVGEDGSIFYWFLLTNVDGGAGAGAGAGAAEHKE